MQERHFLGSEAVQVAQGAMQFGAHVKVEVKKYPPTQALQVPAVQDWQLGEQFLQVEPER